MRWLDGITDSMDGERGLRPSCGAGTSRGASLAAERRL